MCEVVVKKSSFQQLRTLTPEKLALARLILEDVRAGFPVMEAVRRHPVEAGHVSKSALVAAYHQLVESRRVASGRGIAGSHPPEAGPDALRCDHRHRADQALSMPREVHLLPG